MRRNRRRKQKNYLPPRQYVQYNACPEKSCLFNFNGKCLCRESEHMGPLTFDKDCEIVTQITNSDYLKLFKSKDYNVKAGDIIGYNCSDPNKRVKVKILGRMEDGSIQVKVIGDGQIAICIMKFKKIFEYELRFRFHEYLNEEAERVSFLDLGKKAA